MMAKDEASRALGIELVDQGEGWAVTRMTVRDDRDEDVIAEFRGRSHQLGPDS
jgi:hypothetical protein